MFIDWFAIVLVLRCSSHGTNGHQKSDKESSSHLDIALEDEETAGPGLHNVAYDASVDLYDTPEDDYDKEDQISSSQVNLNPVFCKLLLSQLRVKHTAASNDHGYIRYGSIRIFLSIYSYTNQIQHAL